LPKDVIEEIEINSDEFEIGGNQFLLQWM